MSLVWEHSKATEGSLLVMLAIADHAGDDGKAWPGIKTLAKKSRLSDRDVQYCLRKLETLGELKVTRQKRQDGSSSANLYEILALGAQYAPPGANIAPPPAEHCTPPVQPIAPLESSLEPSKNKKHAQRASIPECLATIPGFSEEWDHFREHRKKQRSPMTPHAEELILKRVSQRPAEAIAALEFTMARGWKDVQWDWIDNQKNGQQKPTEQTERKVKL